MFSAAADTSQWRKAEDRPDIQPSPTITMKKTVRRVRIGKRERPTGVPFAAARPADSTRG
jgi:hypothetical protein